MKAFKIKEYYNSKIKKYKAFIYFLFLKKKKIFFSLINSNFIKF